MVSQVSWASPSGEALDYAQKIAGPYLSNRLLVREPCHAFLAVGTSSLVNVGTVGAVHFAALGAPHLEDGTAIIRTRKAAVADYHLPIPVHVAWLALGLSNTHGKSISDRRV